jgi:hypothetical protein
LPLWIIKVLAVPKSMAISLEKKLKMPILLFLHVFIFIQYNQSF